MSQDRTPARQVESFGKARNLLLMLLGRGRGIAARYEETDPVQAQVWWERVARWQQLEADLDPADDIGLARVLMDEPKWLHVMDRAPR